MTAFPDERRRLLDELVRRLIAWFLLRTPKSAHEEILRAARRVAEETMAGLAGVATWDDAEPTGISSMRRPGMVGRVVRVVCSVTAMTTPEFVRLDGAGSIVTILRLTDAEGDQMETLPVVGESVVANLESIARRQETVELLGIVLTVPTVAGDNRLTFVMDVIDVRSVRTAYDILCASKQEREATDLLLSSLATAGTSPLDYVVKELITGLGIVGLDDHPELEDLLKFVALQAASGGRLAHSSGRLHALVIGPPGSGKKLAHLAARLLNSRFAEGGSAKISVAGLVGTSVRSPSGWTSTPGLLARAQGGVLGVQDAHALSRSVLNGIGTVFMELIEDGRVRDSVAGGRQRDADVGLLIDLNRRAHLGLGPGTGEAPMALLRPLLSRVDLILELHGDPRRAWAVGAELYSRFRKAGVAPEAAGWVRQLRLLMGRLHELNPEIQLDDVAPTMKAIHEAIAEQNTSRFDLLPEAGDIPVRLAHSFARLVAASARCHARQSATEADVAVARTFIEHKLSFLALHARDPDANGASAGEWAAYAGFAGQEVKPEDVQRAHREATGHAISARTARRRLQELGGRRTGRGTYLLPPLDAE